MSDERYTGGGYLEANPDWHVTDSAWKAEQVLGMLRRHGLTPRTVCEVGCGAGEILNVLHRALPDDVELTGYEISPQAFELTRTRGRDRLRFELGEPDPEARFDLVLVMDVIEHLEDYFTFLRQLGSVGTHKILHIPLDLSALSVARPHPLLWSRATVGHLHYFVRETALAALRDSGLEVVDHCYTYTGGSPCSAREWLLYGLRRALWRLERDLAARLVGGYSLLVLAR